MGKIDRGTPRDSRHRRVRAKVSGTPERPRLCVFRSSNHIYAQVIDDTAGHTLVAASTLSSGLKDSIKKDDNKVNVARKVGALVGDLAKEKGIKAVVFDRGGYRYHGRIKAIAEGARKAGLEF